MAVTRSSAKRAAKVAANGASKPDGSLPHAPAALCVVVAAFYARLCGRGFAHLRTVKAAGAADQDALLADMLLLFAAYGLEALYSCTAGRSTMYRWTRGNFLEHHVPLVVVGCLLIALNPSTNGRALAQHQEWSALCLFISFNEASAAWLCVYPWRWLQTARLGPNIVVQLTLLGADLATYGRNASLQYRRRDPAMWLPLALSHFLLAAAAVHVDYARGLIRSGRRKPPGEQRVAAAFLIRD